MHTYRDNLVIDAPIGEVFEYYVDMHNLSRMTPPDMRMRVVKAELPLRKGSRVRFALQPKGFPFDVRWDSVICEYERDAVFADKQISGPFSHWLHRHEFKKLDDDRTEVIDTIEFGAPLGIFGRLAEKLFLHQKIQHLFDHRRKVIRRELEARHSPAKKTSARDAAPGG